MINRHVLFVAIAGIALTVGCNKEESSPSTPSTPTPQPEATQMQETGTEATGAGAATQPSELTESAQKLLDQATQYIKDKKWDLADETLNKLEAMKSQLPPEWAGRIEGARKAFDAAKASGAIQVPGGAGVPH